MSNVYPNPPDFRSSETGAAWWKAQPTATSGLQIFATSGGGFVRQVQRRLVAWAGTQPDFPSVLLPGDTLQTRLDSMVVDGRWSHFVQRALTLVARRRGLGPDTIAALEAEDGARAVGRVGTVMAAWLITGLDVRLDTVTVNSTVVAWPAWNSPPPGGDSWTSDVVQIFSPASGPFGSDTRQVVVGARTGGTGGGATGGGTGAPLYGAGGAATGAGTSSTTGGLSTGEKWGLSALAAALLLWAGTRKGKR